MKREELLNKVLELVKDELSEEAIEEIKDYSEEDLKLLLVFRFKVGGMLTNFNCLFSSTSNSLETEVI